MNKIEIKMILPLLLISFFGTALKAQDDVNNISKNDTLRNAGESVYLGYSVQKKSNLTGAVSTVTGEELGRSPVPNLSQALTGRLAGLYTLESYSEPSRATTELHVRGASSVWGNQPLIVIDGIPYNYNSSHLFEYISPSEVESVSMLKDASTQALYGIQGANGVLVITTKRGHAGKLKINIKLDQTFEQTSTRIPFLSSGEYVQLRNEAGYNDGLGRNAFFSENEVRNFISGEDRELYPDNDWRKLNMKDISNMQRVSVDLNGGNDKAQFFTNFNVMHQDGMWKTDQEKYNPNNNFIWANFRSNVDVQFNKYLSTSLNLSGNIKSEKTPGPGRFEDYIYSRLYTVPSSVYGPVTPEITNAATGEITNPGGEVVVTSTENFPAYAVINRLGFAQHTTTNIYAQFAMKLDMSFITEGLNLSGHLAYQTNSTNTLNTTQVFASYIRSSDYDRLAFSKYGTQENTPLANGKSSLFYYNLNYKGILDYNRVFGKHNISAMAYALYQNLTTASTSSPRLLPYKRINSGFEAAYGYDNRYLLKFDLGYSGSEQYASGNRFTAVPAVSAGWVVSNESFVDNSGWLNLLKLRASYGKTANDQSQLGRYIYLDNITMGGGGYLGYLSYHVTENLMANPYLTPEISVKQNYGIDLTVLGGLSVSADVFKERMNNMVSGGTSVTPTYQGIPLENFPKTNSGVFENKGYEISADYTKALGKDFSFNIGGWIAYTKNKIILNDESERADDYAYPIRQEGYSVGQQFGYLVDDHNGNGFFNSQWELDQSNLIYEIGTPRVGDLKYYDLNNDGVINDKDKAPVGTGSLPRYNYAFHADVVYRNFDLSLLFQGIADFWVINNSTGRTEFSYDGVYSEWHKKAWTAERYAAGEQIDYPALSAQKNSNHEANDFFLEDRSYLRLKNVEIGYTFPEQVSNVINAGKIRLYVSGQNLLTWHNLNTKEYGPEGNYLSVPVYRFYNIGLSVKF
jgi:TonB-linked SusC/RagA family outer membrane protein